jgi:hypothetical protein
MTHVPAIKYHQVGNLYGLRNWVEYGLKVSSWTPQKRLNSAGLRCLARSYFIIFTYELPEVSAENR